MKTETEFEFSAQTHVWENSCSQNLVQNPLTSLLVNVSLKENPYRKKASFLNQSRSSEGIDESIWGVFMEIEETEIME